MNDIHLIGFLAGLLTTIAFVPQVVQTWKSKSTKDVSLGMFVTFCTGVFLWLVYGVLMQSLPLIVANFVTLVLATAILMMKLKYG